MSLSQAEWREFLTRYSNELLDWDDLHLWVDVPQPARESRWLGFPPATEEEIASAEARLGRQLPPSLRTFYTVSNGWIALGPVIYDVLPAAQLGWLPEREPGLHDVVAKAENELGPFKDDPDNARLRQYRFEQGTRVKRSLVLNSTGDASTWLLDPETVTANGEWAGGRWSSWNPAMEWYADSFEQLMLAEYEELLDMRDES